MEKTRIYYYSVLIDYIQFILSVLFLLLDFHSLPHIDTLSCVKDLQCAIEAVNILISNITMLFIY